MSLKPRDYYTRANKIFDIIGFHDLPSKIKLIYENIPMAVSYHFQSGGKESIIFLHGLGGGMDCFKDVWDFLGYQQYTTLAVDLPGFGGSDRPLEFSYRMEEQAAITELLIQHLNLDRIHIVGHSMGGAIGLLLAREIKPIVKSFICLEGNLVSEDTTVSREAVRYSLPDFLSTGFQLIPCLSKNDAYAFYRSAESLVKWSDSGKLLEFFLGLDISKYYIFGAQNADAPVMSKLTSVSTLAIPDAGHSMMTDNPSRFYSELLRCIKQT